MTKPAKYPSHLYTLEFHLPSLPILFHHYGTEEAARAAIQIAQPLLNRANGAIERLRLWHKGSLILGLSPNNPGPFRPLPPPDANGVRHIPPTSRALTRPKSKSSLYFNSASINLIDETDLRL